MSTATVSRVLNNSGAVKAQTRRRVLDALEASDYTLNEVARSLAMRHTKTVAILTTDVREFYYAHIAYGIEQRMAGAGYTAFLCNTGTDGARQAEYIRAMLSKRVSAMVVLGSSMRDPALITALIKASRSVPIVLTNANLAAERVFCIERDDAAGVRLGVDRLHVRGCRSVCYASDFAFHSDALKRQVCAEACEQLGLGHTAMSLWDGAPRADGYVCSSDTVAAKLIVALGAKGVRVPADALVVGYDNTDLAQFTSPPLTSVDSDIAHQAGMAAEMLLALLEGETISENHVLITPTLVVRESA